jgi:ribosome recycling factor
LINQPTPEGSDETVNALKKEIEELKDELRRNKKKHEDNINNQLKEFKIIEKKKKKKFDR